MFRLPYNCSHSTMTQRFQIYKLGFKVVEEPEIKLPSVG